MTEDITLKFAIHLLDRTLSCRDENGAFLDLGSGSEFRYNSVQEAVRKAVEATLRYLNAIAAGGNPDYQRLPQLITAGKIQISLHGHQRETYAAAIHLWAAYGVQTEGMPWASEATEGVVRVCADRSAHSFYDTYRFESDIAPIERLAEMTAEWRLVSTGGEPAREADELVRKVRRILGYSRGGEETKRPERIKIGILGVTGAGKSSFVNALLQRHVVPRSESICSSCPVEFWPAAFAKQEGCEVDVLPPNVRQDRLNYLRRAADAAGREATKLIHATSTLQEERRQREAELRNELALLEEAEHHVRRFDGRRLPLASLPRYAAVCATDAVHKLVAKVRVYLAHPLLEHVVLVDTPGLRDPDDNRRRIAIAEISNLDGWLYLAQGTSKFETGISADLTEVREQANSITGALVVTKIDGIDNRSGNVVTSAMALADVIRRTVGWKGRISWCSARAPALAAEILQDSSEQEAWELIASRFEDYGVLNFANRLGDPCTFSASARHKPSRALRSLIELAGADKGLQQGLLDYLLDLSGVPAAARCLAEVVNDQAIRRRVEQGKDALAADVALRIQGARKALEINRRHLDNLGSIERMQTEHSLLTNEIGCLKAQATRREAELQTLDSIAVELRSRYAEGFSQKVERLIPPMLSDLRLKVAKAAANEMSGSRTYSMFDNFDAPLAAWCSEQIAAYRIDLCDRAQETIEGVSSRDLKELTQQLVTHYSLHPKPSKDDDVDDYEDFWEWFDTTLGRMEGNATKKAHAIAAAMEDSFKEKLGGVTQEIIALLREPLDTLNQRRAEVEATLRQLESDTRRIEKGIPGSRALILKRIAELEGKLTKMEAFAVSLGVGTNESEVRSEASKHPTDAQKRQHSAR